MTGATFFTASTASLMAGRSYATPPKSSSPPTKDHNAAVGNLSSSYGTVGSPTTSSDSSVSKSLSSLPKKLKNLVSKKAKRDSHPDSESMASSVTLPALEKNDKSSSQTTKEEKKTTKSPSHEMYMNTRHMGPAVGRLGAM